MSRPIVFPALGREVSTQGYGQRQLYRRPPAPTTAAAGPWHYVGEPGEPAFETGAANAGGGWQTLRFRVAVGGGIDLDGVITADTIPIFVFQIPGTAEFLAEYPSLTELIPGSGNHDWIITSGGQVWVII